MLSKRIIARLDVKGNKLIKGVSFEGVRVIGEPNKVAKIYAQEGADELLISMQLQAYMEEILY